jgi:hypothetical protein
VFEAKESGQSVGAMVKAWRIPDQYKEYAAPDPVRVTANVENAYKGAP